MRHELHKLREKAREVAENQKFEVQRTIAGFRQQENDSLQELQKCQALRATKDVELSSLRDQMVQQQQRAREQRAELEVEFEARLAPLREGAPRSRLKCPARRVRLLTPSLRAAPLPFTRQRTSGSRRSSANE